MFISFNELFAIEDSNSYLLEDQIANYTLSMSKCKEDIESLKSNLIDKEKIIGFFEKEKVTNKKDVLHFLEETHDIQTHYLNNNSSLSVSQKKDIQNTIINMTNTIATSYFVTTGLISKSELEKIIPKYKGIVRPADPEEKK